MGEGTDSGVTSQRKRLLWFADSPSSATGSGSVTRNVCGRLAAKYDVFCAANGYVGMPFEFGNLKIVSSGGVMCGGGGALGYLNKIIEADFSVLFGDFNVLSHALNVPKFERRIFYIPIDFVRLPYAWGDSFRDLDTLVVASKFGQKVAMNYNKESVYIPHGVDCNIFKKLTDSERRFLRKQQNIKDDDFVVSFVGKPLVRKMLPTMLKVFEEFAKDKGNVKLLMASDPNEKSMRCVNYVSLAQQLRIQKKMLVPPFPVSRFPLGDSTMSNTFNTADVHLFLSGAEGFGLPVLETQACGVPQIVSDYTTLPELVEGHGKIVPIASEIANESGVFYGVADEGKAVEALNFYYDNRDELKEDGKKSIEFAKKFDYNTSDIIPKWIEVLESDIMSWEVY